MNCMCFARTAIDTNGLHAFPKHTMLQSNVPEVSPRSGTLSSRFKIEKDPVTMSVIKVMTESGPGEGRQACTCGYTPSSSHSLLRPQHLHGRVCTGSVSASRSVMGDTEAGTAESTVYHVLRGRSLGSNAKRCLIPRTRLYGMQPAVRGEGVLGEAHSFRREAAQLPTHLSLQSKI
jgi:hypothetical protein